MVVWKGQGAIGIMILLGSLIFSIFGSQYLAQRFPNHFPATLPMDVVPFAMAVGGMTCWFLGRHWNRNDEPETGLNLFESIRENIEDADHTIFWLPMEYWGGLSTAFALLIAGMMLISGIVSFFTG